MASKKYYVVYDLVAQQSIRTDSSNDDVAFNTVSVGGEAGPVLSATLDGNFDFDGKKLTNFSAASWLLKNGSYSIVNGDRILANTNSSAISLTLPSTPSTGDWCEIMDAYGTWSTHNCTVLRNGLKIEGTAEDLILNVSGGRIVLSYVDTTRGWTVGI